MWLWINLAQTAVNDWIHKENGVFLIQVSNCEVFQEFDPHSSSFNVSWSLSFFLYVVM
jgi:hypothetical protein